MALAPLAAAAQHRRAARPGPTWCPTAPTSSTCTSTSAAPPRSDAPARCMTTSTPTRRPTSRCRSPIRRSRRCVFYPLHLLPFGVVAFVWQLGIVAALYGVCALSLRLLGPRRSGGRRCCGRRSASGSSRCAAPSTTARSTCCWCSRCCARCTAADGGSPGLLVGLAAGSSSRLRSRGCTSSGRAAGGRRCSRRSSSSARSGCPLLVLGEQARYYFTELLGDAGRVGPIGDVVQPVLARRDLPILGHDAGYGPSC